MEEARGMESEKEMAAEAEKATVPQSAVMRLQTKAVAQASGLPDGTGWNNSENHGDRIKECGYYKDRTKEWGDYWNHVDETIVLLNDWYHSDRWGIARKKDPFGSREQVGDREEGSSDWTQTSLPVEKPQHHGKDNQKKESFLEISEREMLADGGESSSTSTLSDIPKEPMLVDSGESSSARETTTDWTLLIASLILECLAASFDQLGGALPGIVIAFIALVISTVDLFRSAQKEKMTWDRRSLLPSSTRDLATRKPSETIVSCFGFICAVWQCVQSTTGYAYSHQNKDNPIKMTLLPFVFLGCLFFIKKTTTSPQVA